MAKKFYTMSIAIEPGRHELLKRAAERAGHGSLSHFVRQWLDQYPVHKDDVLPVVFDIPKSILGDRPALERHIAKSAKQLLELLADG